MIYLNNNQGLTLIRLIVGMTLLGLIMAGITPLFSTSLDVMSNGMTKDSLLQEGRWVVDMIAKDISAIDINKITTPTLPTATTATTAATLTFIPFKSSTPVTPVTYSVVNREVCRQEGTGIQRPMTDGKRNTNSSATLKFTRNIDGISIDIELTLTKADNKNRISTENIKTTIFPLNNGNDN